MKRFHVHLHVDRLGFQTDDPAELAGMKARAEAADMALLDEGTTTCCYARSEKHWVTDPQGIAWEHFHTLGDIPVFRQAHDAPAVGCCAAHAPGQEAAEAAGCCAPAPAGEPAAAPVKASARSCC